MAAIDFATAFKVLTGNDPFPWQQALYARFEDGEIPESCNLPTGLGKTSLIAVWLIALANGVSVPRRLVYVVNRRTVVDQTTDEVEKYRERMHECPELVDRLLDICCPTPTIPFRHQPLALSTLRGQFADNREWSADPSRTAVICGTVDMIGSRLLFSGYGIGFKQKPLHAGFLGQDALLVHDEAHLEPAFQCLVTAIEKEQAAGERTGTLPWPKLRVIELTATSRGEGRGFELTPAEKEAPEQLPDPPTEPLHYVWRRTHSKKAIILHKIDNEKEYLVPELIRLALLHKEAESTPAVLVFVRTIELVTAVVAGLKKSKISDNNICTLTGTMRGYERDSMTRGDGVFARFVKDSPAAKQPGTVYLVCTSAGEVGVDMSADHMLCDLSTFDSMAQRFGRVNRYGNGDARIDVVHQGEFDAKEKPFEAARRRTLQLLGKLGLRTDGQRDASPASIGKLIERVVREGAGGDNSADRATAIGEYVLSAFAPTPTILPVADILFDAWALTTIREKLPGRPKVEPYLHGVSETEAPETHVAWREEVERLHPHYPDEATREEQEADDRKALAKLAGELLDEYPLRPRELLREPSYQAFKQFEAMARRCPALPVWVVDDDGNVEVLSIRDLADKDEKERIEGMTILLPPSAGGLVRGMLDGSAPPADRPELDVADECSPPNAGGRCFRVRMLGKDHERAEGMRLIRALELPTGKDGDGEPEEWLWFTRENNGEKSSPHPVEWRVHVGDVVDRVKGILANLRLPSELHEAVLIAANYHDHGKQRASFQRVLGNARYPCRVWAKSGRGGGTRLAETYRHEFGSLLDADDAPDDLRDVILHLIAAHHGRARPHFPPDEAFDPDHAKAETDRVAAAVPRRFARLQRKYGRWGLAYLESILRAADWAASAAPSRFVEEGRP